MAALNFTKEGEFYIAETTVNNDYALHIERRSEGFFYMEQSSISDGEYAGCNLPTDVSNGFWVNGDYFFSHGYYPMKVRFKSLSEVKKAEINEKKRGVI